MRRYLITDASAIATAPTQKSRMQSAIAATPTAILVVAVSSAAFSPLRACSLRVGAWVGTAVGALVGTAVGALVGTAVGALVGTAVGALVGACVGTAVGALVGSCVGTCVGTAVGALVGTCVGTVGALVGACVGTAVQTIGGGSQMCVFRHAGFIEQSQSGFGESPQ